MYILIELLNTIVRIITRLVVRNVNETDSVLKQASWYIILSRKEKQLL